MIFANNLFLLRTGMFRQQVWGNLKIQKAVEKPVAIVAQIYQKKEGENC